MLENYVRFLCSAHHRSWTNIQQAVRYGKKNMEYLYLAIKCSDLFYISINTNIPLSTYASLTLNTSLCLCYAYFTVTLPLLYI